MNECMPHYYKITNGHGLGAELVMDAEADFMQGKLSQAAIGLARARARIAGSRQENMALCCDFLQLRLSLFGKTPPLDVQARKNALPSRHDMVLLNMFDSILAYHFALSEKTQSIPEVFGVLVLANGFDCAKGMVETGNGVL